MAGNAVIGALRVVLGLDAAALDKGLKQANLSLQGFAKGLTGIAAGVTAAGLAIATVVGVAVKKTIDQADQLGKTAQKIGVPVEQLSALKYAAELSDVSLEALQKGLVKVSRALTEAAGDPASKSADAFRALGINVRDANGAVKSSDQILLDVAEAFSGLKDGAGKTAVAVQLFGRAGADLIPLLNQGRGGITELTNEAKLLGIVIGGNTAKASEAFNDNMKRVHTIVQSVALRITEGMLPGLVQLSLRMADAARSGEGFQAVGKAVTDVLQKLYEIGTYVVVVFQRIGAEFSALNQVASTWPFTEARAKAVENMNRVSAETTRIFKELRVQFSEFDPDALMWIGGFTKQTEEANKKLKDFNYSALAGKSGVDSFIDGIKKQTEGLKAQVDAFGQTGIAADALKIVYEGLSVAGSKNIAQNEALRLKLMGVAEAHARAKLAAEAAKIATDDVSPFEKFNNTMRDLNLLLEKNDINWAIYSKNVQRAQRELVQADPYIQAFGQSLSTAFDAAIQGGKKFSEILQNLLKDLSRALANAAFRQLLFGGTGAGSGVLGSLFGGLSLPGLQHGGSFAVGGSGGIDSQLVAFRASPNETVSVSKNGAAMAGMVFNYAPIIDARGADAAAVARLAKNQQDMANTLRPTIRDEFNRYRQQIPGV